MAEADDRSLSSHAIIAAEVIKIGARYPRAVGRNAVLGSHGMGPLADAVILRTTGGAVGWGIVCGQPGNPDVLIGRRLDELFDPTVGVTDDSALWADLAVHDLAGVLLGQPVYQLLGGRGEQKIPVYDASIYFDDLDPEESPRGIEVVLEHVRDGWDAGYRAFKLKIGRGCTWMPAPEGLERDIAVTRAVRGAFPTARLLVDGNNGFTIDGILQYLERVSDVDLYWVEEPFHEDRGNLQRLRSWLDANSPQTLIADGEHRPNVDEVVNLAREGLIDVLLMDITDFGLTAWRRLAPSIERCHARSSPHAWGHPLKTLYAAQAGAGLPGIEILEGVRGVTVGVDTNAYALEDGAIVVPDIPGFGIPTPTPSRASTPILL